MPPNIQVKICGLRTEDDVRAAADAGARYIGLNFFPKSPRSVDFQTARDLALTAPPGLAKVGLVVDPTDDVLDALCVEVPLDMIQLHGHETQERVADVRNRTGLPVMKVVGVAEPSDLAVLDTYAEVADQLMVDAKPPKNAVLPGGNGVAFDWSILANRKYWTRPWMLAGGLTPQNVAEAIRLTGASQVDVASGVETEPGRKDPALMAAFCKAALTAS